MGKYDIPDPKVCPVCGAKFIPAPQHSYILKKGKKKVCSYACMRTVEKAKERKEAPANG